jgi:hypothetical protein
MSVVVLPTIVVALPTIVVALIGGRLLLFLPLLFLPLLVTPRSQNTVRAHCDALHPIDTINTPNSH